MKVKFNRKKVIKMFKEKEITSCEVRLEGCTGSYCLTPAHRFKRRFYPEKGDINEFNQIVVACMNCHQKMEKDKNLTAEIFKKLRGK